MPLREHGRRSRVSIPFGVRLRIVRITRKSILVATAVVSSLIIPIVVIQCSLGSSYDDRFPERTSLGIGPPTAQYVIHALMSENLMSHRPPLYRARYAIPEERQRPLRDTVAAFRAVLEPAGWKPLMGPEARDANWQKGTVTLGLTDGRAWTEPSGMNHGLISTVIVSDSNVTTRERFVRGYGRPPQE